MPRARSRSIASCRDSSNALRFNGFVVPPVHNREALEQAVVRGSELLKQGKLDLAQRSFLAALELEPDNARVLALLGLSHFRANAFAEARVIYEQLVERAPTDASHRLNLGLVYLKLSDADRAIAALEASRALDPSQGRAVSYLGLAYARAGRYGEAYRAFLIAGQIDLAIEIEANLTTAERDRIHAQLGRSPQGPLPAVHAVQAGYTVPSGEPAAHAAHAPAPAEAPRTSAAPAVPRTPSPSPSPPPPPTGAPRTKPPGAPPGKPRTSSQELPDASSPEPSREITILREPDEAAPPEAPLAATGVVTLAAAPASSAPEPVRITDSMQFVLPRAELAVPQPEVDGPSRISQAVAVATPALAAGLRTAAGGAAPRPLSELATDDLVRPDEGDEAFEIGANGALIIRVTERVMTRLDGVHITGGDLGYEPAMRRSRGHNTDEPFDHGGSQVHAIIGHGYLIAVPGKHSFRALSLDDDILYLREDLVFAFETSLRWENGNVPGLRGKLPIVQFRGDGTLALRLLRPLVRVKLPAQGVVFVDAERLAGWIGRVIPRAVVPPAGGPLGTMCVECTGEGIVLIEPAPDDELAAPRSAPRPPRVAPELEAAVVAPIKRDGSPRPPDPGGPESATDSLDHLDEL
jgi:tetratricopeptide repeat protein